MKLPAPWSASKLFCAANKISLLAESESEVPQSCPTFCDPMDCILLGSSSTGFFRQEYWSGLPFPSPGDLPDTGIEPGSPTLQADSFLKRLSTHI